MSRLPHRRPRCWAVVSAAVLGAAMLSSCSTGSTATDDAAPEQQSESEVDADAFPVTIEHAFGETTIEEEPTRVATLGWTDQDNALALGVVPGRRHQADLGWQRGGLLGLVRRESSRSWVAPSRCGTTTPTARRSRRSPSSTPDLILATNSGITEAEYKKLSKIARGRRLPRGTVDHAVAGLARDRRQGPGPHVAGRRCRRGGAGGDRARPRRTSPRSRASR